MRSFPGCLSLLSVESDYVLQAYYSLNIEVYMVLNMNIEIAKLYSHHFTIHDLSGTMNHTEVDT